MNEEAVEMTLGTGTVVRGPRELLEKLGYNESGEQLQDGGESGEQLQDGGESGEQLIPATPAAEDEAKPSRRTTKTAG